MSRCGADEFDKASSVADNTGPPGRSSAWLERVVWDHEVAGSNPVAPIAALAAIEQERGVRESRKRKSGALARLPLLRSRYYFLLSAGSADAVCSITPARILLPRRS